MCSNLQVPWKFISVASVLSLVSMGLRKHKQPVPKDYINYYLGSIRAQKPSLLIGWFKALINLPCNLLLIHIQDDDITVSFTTMSNFYPLHVSKGCDAGLYTEGVRLVDNKQS